MQTLPFTLSDDKLDQPAVGLVVLQSDETMEHELRHWLPQHYRLFHTRITNSQTINASSLQAMKEELPVSVSLLPKHTNFRVIAYGCTSAATVIGEAAVSSAIQSVFANSLVTNPVTAVKAKLNSIQAKNIGLLTPYEPQVSKALRDNLEDSGYAITNSGTFNEMQDHKVARISRQSLLDAIQKIAHTQSNKPPIDAVFASCTNLRTYDLLDEASSIIGCPVISSNSALAWHIEALLNSPINITAIRS